MQVTQANRRGADAASAFGLKAGPKAQCCAHELDACEWFMAAVALWNRAASRSLSHPTDWLVVAMRDNVHRSLYGELRQQDQISLWSTQFRQVLLLLSTPDFLPDVSDLFEQATRGSFITINLVDASEAFQQYLFTAMRTCGDDPRGAPGESVVYSTYENWFASTPCQELSHTRVADWCYEGYDLGGMKPHHLQALTRFRFRGPRP